MAAIRLMLFLLLSVSLSSATKSGSAGKKVNAAPLDIGLREMPAEESAAMKNFKKNLSPADQALLASQKSKTRFIQALLDGKRVIDRRDKIQAVRGEDAAGQCCNCNPGSHGCYHAADVKRSRIIRCCIPRPRATDVKRAEASTSDVDKVISQLSPADQQLIQKHPTKVQNLVKAAAKKSADKDERAVQNGKKEAKKELQTGTHSSSELYQKLQEELSGLKQTIDELKSQHHQQQQVSNNLGAEDITSRLADDVTLAKSKGIKLEELLSALKKRGTSGPAKKH